MTRRKVCFVVRCSHRHEDGWEHVVPVRRTVVRAHIWVARGACGMTAPNLCECGCGQVTRISKWTSVSQGYVAGQHRRFVNGHQNRGQSTEERFWAKVEKTDTCWLWTASLNRHGYGQFRIEEDRRASGAHRFSYEQVVGPIPPGLTLDHLCRNRACVNPAHLEPVTVRENTLRSPIAITAVSSRMTHCKRGHEFTLENTYVWRRHRDCRTCSRLRRRRARQRRATLGRVA